MSSIPIRVLVVDDSPYMRKVIKEMLEMSPVIEVVATAYDGRDALDKVTQFLPDVVVLDLEMPVLDGIGFLRAQAERFRLPVVICSIHDENSEKALIALEAGAVEFVHKPSALANEQIFGIEENLIEKVYIAANVRLEKMLLTPPAPGSALTAAPTKGMVDAIVIGISTGGPQALRQLVPVLPKSFPVPIAMVLHMPVGFTGPFAERLNGVSAIEVMEAREGDEMKPGRALLAPAGRHLSLIKRYDKKVVAHLDINPSNTYHRPSVDVLFRSAADVYGGRLLGVVMTGMGNEGTIGSGWIKAGGGLIYVESEQSCVVYGMPRSVVEAGLADNIFPLERMALALIEIA
jgi:two-component system chemotaxis response regulator CheB